MKPFIGLTIASTLSFFAISCSGVTASRTQVKEMPFSNALIEAQVDSIYNAMTMDERVAQIHGVRSKLLTVNGKLSLDSCRKYIPHGVGHVAQFATTQSYSAPELRAFVEELQNYLTTETRTKLPAIFHEEAITGFATLGATTFPQQIGVACGWNPELVELKSEYTRQSMRSGGATMALSPMVDIVRTQRFNRVEESYGEDSYLTSAMGHAFIVGLQGEDLRTGIATCTKHYLGYGGGSTLSEKELIEEVITPHEVGIKLSGNKAVMPGYHSFKDETAITNEYFLQELLRGYLSFDGLIVSDYFATAAKGRAKGNPNHFHERATKAMNAGADLELCDLECFKFLPELIEQGKVSEERFKQAVKTNLTMKARLGLLDPNPKYISDDKLDLDDPKFRKLAYEMAAQSVVLLKNNGILPLQPSTPKVALLGPNANSVWALLGDYTYQAHHSFFQAAEVNVNEPKLYTIKEGLEEAMGDNFKITYERGCSWDGAAKSSMQKGSTNGDARLGQSKLDFLNDMLVRTSDPYDWNKAMRIAKSNDVIIVAVGENVALCGEGRNRKGIRLPGEQEAFVEELIDTNKPVVVVVCGGRAQVLSEKIRSGAAAIMHAWYSGEEGGRAIADILVGKVNPSAKLCVSYPAVEKSPMLCYNYGEEKMAQYVAYPFGYGLSYTKYSYSDIKSTPSAEIERGEVTVEATITNSGKMAGEEVVQLYIKPISKDIDIKPIQLKGFQRVALKAGESKVVKFTFLPELISLWEGGKWHVKAGDYEVAIAASSSDIKLTASLTLTGENRVTPNREVYFSTSSIE